MNKEIENVLEDIGLYKNEIIIYTDLIKVSKASALELAKRTGIHRSNAYTALAELVSKGLVSEIVEEDKKYFRALPVSELKDYVKHMFQETEKGVENIVPKLKEISSDKKEGKNSVEVSEGLFAAKEMLKEVFSNSKDLYGFGISKGFFNGIGEGFLKGLIDERLKKEFKIKSILYENLKRQTKILKNRKFLESKYVGDSYSGPVSKIISDDIVLIFVFSNPIHVIKIKNKVIAESYISQFNLLWNRVCEC